MIQNQNDLKNSYYGCVVSVAYFVKNSICDDLPQFSGDACKVNVSYLNSRNQNNQTFQQIQNVLLLISLSQKTQEPVLNVDVTVTKYISV